MSGNGLVRGAGAKPAAPTKRALIYLPHLGHTEGASVGDLAIRIAAACSDRDREATYSVQSVAEPASFGLGAPPETASAVSVVRRAAEGTETALAIYELGYTSSLVDRYEKGSRLTNALLLMSIVSSNLMRLARSVAAGRTQSTGFTRGLLRASVFSNVALLALACVYLLVDPPHVLGWWLAGVVLVCVGIVEWAAGSTYTDRKLSLPFGIVAGAGAGAVSSLAGLGVLEWVDGRWAGTLGTVLLAAGVLGLVFVSLKLANPDLGMRVQLAIGFGVMGWLVAYTILVVGAVVAQGWDLFFSDTDSVLAEGLVGFGIASSAIGIAVGSKARERLRKATTDLVAAAGYMSMGEGRDSQVGRFYDLVHHLVKEGQEIDVVGYSFGSVLALDALYPIGNRGVPLDEVKRLVTIGCPMMTIGTFWPRYWEGRDKDSWTGRWFRNVYSPFDILSSNITSRDDGIDAAVWITPKTPNATIPRPDCDCIFNSGASTDELGAGQKLFVGGLRAHANYWRTPFENDRGAIAWLGDMWTGADWSGAPAPAAAAVTGTPEAEAPPEAEEKMAEAASQPPPGADAAAASS